MNKDYTALGELNLIKEARRLRAPKTRRIINPGTRRPPQGPRPKEVLPGATDALPTSPPVRSAVDIAMDKTTPAPAKPKPSPNSTGARTIETPQGTITLPDTSPGVGSKFINNVKNNPRKWMAGTFVTSAGVLAISPTGQATLDGIAIKLEDAAKLQAQAQTTSDAVTAAKTTAAKQKQYADSDSKMFGGIGGFGAAGGLLGGGLGGLAGYALGGKWGGLLGLGLGAYLGYGKGKSLADQTAAERSKALQKNVDTAVAADAKVQEQAAAAATAHQDALDEAAAPYVDVPPPPTVSNPLADDSATPAPATPVPAAPVVPPIDANATP